MQIANNSVFNNSASGYGNWIDIARYTAWSLHVMGLETGAVLTIAFSNEVKKPADQVLDSNAIISATTITGTGSPQLLSGASFPVAHWMQVHKTAAGSPQDTVVWQFAQMSAN